MLYLNLVMIRKRHWSSGQQTSMGAGTISPVRFASGMALVSIAYIASHTNARADLTHEQVYSLSPTTHQVLSEIKSEHPVRVSGLRLDRRSPRLRRSAPG